MSSDKNRYGLAVWLFVYLAHVATIMTMSGGTPDARGFAIGSAIIFVWCIIWSIVGYVVCNIGAAVYFVVRPERFRKDFMCRIDMATYGLVPGYAVFLLVVMPMTQVY